MSESQSRLSPKQFRFCEEYLLDLNPAGAYLRAGYRCKDADVARRAASRLLTNVDVQNQIRKLTQERSQRTRITSDRVLEEIGRVAFANMADYATWGPQGLILKDSTSLDCEHTCVIADINFQNLGREGVHIKIKLHDKMTALTLAAKHIGLLGDMNVALNTFRKYGFIVKQVGTSYLMVDGYALEEPNVALDDLEKGIF